VTQPETLAAAAERALAADPEALAVIDGSTRSTRRDLDARAGRIAVAMRQLGVSEGSRVALLARPSANGIAALYAIARVGATAVPLSPALTGGELGRACALTRPAVVLHDADLEGTAAQLAPTSIDLDDGTAEPVAGVAAQKPVPGGGPAEVDPEAPTVIVLTSGTTGDPKAAVLSHRAMMASADAWLAALPPATGWLLGMSLAHVAGLGTVWRATVSGVPLVVSTGNDPAAILAALRSEPHPSHVSLVPTMMRRLLDLRPARDPRDPRDPRDAPDLAPPETLRAVPLGGGPIAADLVEQALVAGWPVIPTYGLTEAGSGVTALPTLEVAAHPSSAGRPLPGVRIRIDGADADGIGEIAVDTPARFSGYLDDPDATAATTTSDGWLRTGDLGRLDEDGRLTVVDRRTDRIVRGGENVSPAEVEAVLLRHPAIEDAAVVARADPVYGQVPVAVVVVRPGTADPSDDALAAYCREQLARFKVPVAFDRRSSLPRTPSGKLRRTALRDAPEGEPA
jgi:O-succinylbenzoic acid--CoA ligase